MFVKLNKTEENLRNCQKYLFFKFFVKIILFKKQILFIMQSTIKHCIKYLNSVNTKNY